MRNGGLRQFDALLDIAGAESGLLVERASAFFLERAQNATTRGVGNGVEKAVEMGSGVGHKDNW